MPKSTAFPVDAIVSDSIRSLFPDAKLPPANNTFVFVALALIEPTSTAKSPNSRPLPSDAIVTYSVCLNRAGFGSPTPPPNIPLTELDPPPYDLRLIKGSPNLTEFPFDAIVID